MSADSPEQLLDAFKAAALSVTKLYKTSASAQTKARADGYQDCLDDLLAYLDKENIGVGDGEGWKIRRWATERLDGRDSVSQTVESDDEGEKTETASSPEIHRSNSATHLNTARNDTTMRVDSAPPTVQSVSVQPPIAEEPEMIVVPSQETFTFQSSHPYPQESYLNLANLDLSDGRPLENSTAPPPPTISTNITPRLARTRRNSGGRTGSRSSNHLGRSAGQKRKLNFAEIFDLGSLGYPKDVFGNGGGKRSRHT